ncbi:hypothetical protein MGYG_03433 [Nannizzia gypsea CBS 118893]|uniref:Zn(2)-C6 fungal-type domain-containing protein n=1 Tax=Arthroderma gypseum (strain ATCC MYA-4604 / CBS 118893) TaxID=535722 RepID=E4URV8_ARTGP|nr:hypothetical protein MGYG_03433 [Nannizzia gypsea CBS 118893]EFR00429.1 hypothetical protein MGYG_03433 [Nannizzia gypsea CBS 118893]
MHSSCSPSEVSSWGRMRRTCDACQESKVKCSQTKPSCHRCIRHSQPCIYSPHRRTGRPRKRACRSTADAEGPVAEQATQETRTLGILGPTNRVQLPNTPNVLSARTGEDGNNLNHDVFPSLDSLLDISLCEKGSYQLNNSWQESQQTSYPPGSSLDTLNDDFTLDHDVSFPLPSQALDIDESPQFSTRAPSTTNSNADRDCRGRCYMMLLQRLSFLHRSLPESSRPSVDAILLVQRSISRNVSDKLLQCTTCVSNRSTILLLSTIIERVVLMFNWIIEKKTLMDSKNARLSRLALCSWALNPSVPPPADSFQRTFCHVPLMVGDVELDAKTKHAFMKPLIILRIKKLAVMLQELSRITASRSQDCLYRASGLILVDCQQRLDYLRGQVQIWE